MERVKGKESVEMEEIFKEHVLLDGKRVTVTLSASGVLLWQGQRRQQQGQLVVADDLVGFKSSASTILLHTFKRQESSQMCGGKGVAIRQRKDMLLEFSNDAAHGLWCDAIQRALDESGTLLVLWNFYLTSRLRLFDISFQAKGMLRQN